MKERKKKGGNKSRGVRGREGGGRERERGREETGAKRGGRRSEREEEGSRAGILLLFQRQGVPGQGSRPYQGASAASGSGLTSQGTVLKIALELFFSKKTSSYYSQDSPRAVLQASQKGGSLPGEKMGTNEKGDGELENGHGRGRWE